MNSFLIVEKEFIRQLSFEKMESKYQDELIDFLENKFSGYFLICDILDDDEFFSLRTLNPIWSCLADKNMNVDYVEKCDLGKINENYVLNQALILSTKENETSFYLENECFIFKPETIDDVWEKFKFLLNTTNATVSQSKHYDDNEKIVSWEGFRKYSLLNRDLVIFDKYILTNSKTQKRQDNLLPMLVNLLKENSKSINQSHITIISDFKTICDASYDEKNKSFLPLMKRIHTEIADYLKSNGVFNFKINLINYSSFFEDKIKLTLSGERYEGLHDRYIISNYFFTYCSSSYTFFDSFGKVNNETKINFCPSFIKPGKHFAIKKLIDIKTYIESLGKNEDSDVLTEPYKTKYFPDKSNPLLDCLII